MKKHQLKAKQEQNILKLSIGVTIGLSVFGILMGIVTGASSIIFDGIYSTVDCFYSIAALGITRLIQFDTGTQKNKAPVLTERFQFGFWHLEPMLLAINGISLMIAVFYGMAEAVTTIWHGGHMPKFNHAIFYAIIAVVVCYGLAFYEMRANRKIKSAFIAIDAKSWFISGCISLALLIAFVFAVLIKNTPAYRFLPYIDSSVLIIICMIMAPMPLRIVINAIKEIFLIAPRDIDENVTRVVDAVVEKYAFAGSETYVAKVGRSTMIEVHLILPKGYKIKNVDWIDKIRGEIGDAIGGGGPDRWFTVCFTAKPEWT